MANMDFPPTAWEVRQQLKHILASPRLKNAMNQSAFLEFTVDRACEGKDTTGRQIADALFAGKYYPGLTGDVRSTALNLRRTLGRYYDNEGKNDVVVISYPEPHKDRTIKPVEGEAYTPRFWRNPNHEPYVLVRIAYRFLGNETLRDYYKALNLFTQIESEDPGNVSALLGIVEAIIKFAERTWQLQFTEWRITESLFKICGGTGTALTNHLELPPAVEMCANIFREIENRAKDYWRFWVVQANFLHQLERPGVASFYETAIKLDRSATETFVPYWYYLVETNRSEEAMGLAHSFRNEHVEDAYAISEYGRLLCSAGRREQGIGHLEAAVALHPGNCSALQSLAVLRFMEKDIPRVVSHLRALKMACEPDTFRWFIGYLKEHEGQFELEGSVATMLLELPSETSVAIVKP